MKTRTERFLGTLNYISAISSAIHMACSNLDKETLLRFAMDIMIDTLNVGELFSAVYLKEKENYTLQVYRAPIEPPYIAPAEFTKEIRGASITEVKEIPEFAKEHCAGGTILLVPLAMQKRVSGFIALCSQNKVQLNELQDEILVAISSIFAMGIELFRLYEELSNRITELQAMQKRLIENERMTIIQRLLAGIAHEIKNPLSAAYGLAQELEAGKPVDEEFLKRLLSALGRTKDQVFKLLDYAKPHPPKLAVISAASLVEESLSLVVYEIRRKNLTVLREFSNDVRVNVDRAQVQQAVLNLIMNAVEATDNNGRIRLRVKNYYNGDAQIIVADTGCGISPENIKRLYEPFFTTKVGGSGLGLYTVFQVVKSNGGRILARSRVGRGTVFSLIFPPAS
ncbi:MAG: ATP-binding protein [Planctomycetota bacterium]|nr:ATP-binding protein [Planctomycetota bacterium]